MSFATPAEVISVDPAALNPTGLTHGAYGNALYGGLMTDDPTTGELFPGIAESIESADGLAWTLRVRPGVTFSDGTPLDAAAVQFNWDRHRDPEIASTARAASSAVVTTEVADAQTLRFTLAAPNAQFARVVLSSAMNWVGSPQALAAGRQSFDGAPVGAGPFVLTSWQRNDRMVLSKNPLYWDSPRPYLDELVLRPISDTNQRVASVRSGDVDAAIHSNPMLAKEAEEAGDQRVVSRINGSWTMYFNTTTAPFDDVRLRQAVVAGVDLQKILGATYAGNGEVPTALIGAKSPMFDPSMRLPGYDPVRSKQLFDELAAEGGELAFAIALPDVPEASKAAQSVQTQLAAVTSARIDVVVADLPTALSQMANRQFDAIISSIQFTDPEPGLYEAFHTGSPRNYSGLSDPEVDAALEAGRRGVDVSERASAYRTVHARIEALSPGLFYTVPQIYQTASADVGGLRFYGLGSPTVDEIWRARP